MAAIAVATPTTRRSIRLSSIYDLWAAPPRSLTTGGRRSRGGLGRPTQSGPHGSERVFMSKTLPKSMRL